MFDFMTHIGYDALDEVGASAEELLATLDANGVQGAIVSPIGDGWVHRFRDRNRELAAAARDHASAGDRAAARDHASAHDHASAGDRAAARDRTAVGDPAAGRAARLVFFCTVNPWFGDTAIEELTHCITTLGARGVALHPARQGFSIDSPLAAPLLEACHAAHAPVYVHTGTPVFGLPLNVANAARRYPDLPFVIGRMGASDYWGDIIPAAQSADNVFVETSLNANVPAVLHSLLGAIGPERVLFGTNFPYSSYRVEVEKLRACRLDDATAEKLFGSNALRLLGLERAA